MNDTNNYREPQHMRTSPDNSPISGAYARLCFLPFVTNRPCLSLGGKDTEHRLSVNLEQIQKSRLELRFVVPEAVKLSCS